MKRIESIDLLRTFMLVTVFLCHAWVGDSPIRNFVATSTGSCMELFFIISGCMIAIKYSQKDINYKVFVRKELIKFYPEYLVAFVCSIWYSIDRLHFFGEIIPWREMSIKAIANLLLCQSWFSTEEYVYSFNGVSWFLSSLFFCYLIAPLLIKFLKPIRNYAFFYLILVITIRFVYLVVVTKWWSSQSFLLTDVMPAYRIFEFVCGMLLGLTYDATKDRKSESFYQICGGLVFWCLFIINKYFYSFNFIFIIAELFLVYCYVFYDGVCNLLGNTKVIKSFVSISMPFYLFHNQVIQIYTWIAWKKSIDIYNCIPLTILNWFILTVLISFVTKYIRIFITSKRKTKYVET